MTYCTAISLKRKLKNAQEALMSAEGAFAELDTRVLVELHELWAQQEKLALENRATDPKSMDIFEVQLEKVNDWMSE